jgi:hypothetical protein
MGEGDEHAGLRNWIGWKTQKRWEFHKGTRHWPRGKLEPEGHQDIAYATLQVIFGDPVCCGDTDFPERARKTTWHWDPHSMGDRGHVNEHTSLDGFVS